ncbi:VWA domain-containing protein [Oceanospirillum linum]|uniref:VWFA domain-containing protein n=1 Tax=Oceanospirillum linum TaxID=966 RepID=A0A1T1H9W9_OCELI|nr:VWA domain-containing protein [Oceanospirillum linum]OOV86661.1 hypothetical protein BTA35_0212300 [Oceanospirillum linum]SEG26954.1 Ca-activated chloride channel family protein [Oleiphilus messinensis]SMP27547.1 Ca-activated chloride channel family protein [Oceanospirillum linum]
MELLNSFHFARPWALLLIPLVVIQVIWYLRFRHASNPWQDRMRPDLQQQLLAKPEKQPGYLLWTLTALSLAGIALAGPSWSQQSRPALIKQDNLVIVLDLSLSMLAEDSQPNRITRSKQKLQDLLKQRDEGMTALVVYSGDAHVVTPLTQDTATIRNLLPALDPLMMPKLGSAAEAGISKAVELVRQSGFQKARLLLMTDGLDHQAQKAIRKQLPNNLKLSIMTVGTEAGAPIPLDHQGFVKDPQGNVIISKLDRADISSFAASVNALIHPITLDDDDLRALLPQEIAQQELKESQAQLPLWIEQGHWFLLPVLPLIALAFRRNWLLILPLFVLLGTPKPVFAFWPETPQIQGEKAFTQGHYSEAQKLLEDPLWRGSALYRQKDYPQAISEFSKSDTPLAHYNRGNALAKLGRFDEAMNAYSKALEQNPALKDAEYNRALIEELLKQQEKNQQKAQQNASNQSQSEPQKQKAQNPQSNNSSADSPAGMDNQGGSPGNPTSDGSQSSEPNRDQRLGPDDDSSMFGPNSPEMADQGEPEQSVLDKLAEQEKKQQDRLAKQQSEQKTDNTSDQNSSTNSGMSEEELSLEQWLRRIPDDPAGLLRRKFEYEANQRREPLPEGRAPW